MLSIIIFAIAANSFVSGDYWSDRALLVQQDVSQTIGARIVLNDKELAANDVLMSAKWQEMDDGFKNPQDFLAGMHFFHSKPLIDESKVFQFIQKLPKGASLHSHDSALVSFDFVYNLTFSDKLYSCVVNDRLKFRFFGGNADNQCDWQLVSQQRKQNPTFEDFLKSQLTIIVDNPAETYADINTVWGRFLDTFGTVYGLLCYKPIFQEYFYQALKELYDDNVFYLEFRGLLPEVYDLEGNLYGPEQVAEMYVETLHLFKDHYPEFYGARFIFAPSRHVDNRTVGEYLKIVANLKKRYPDFIAGFDLVGQEDKGYPLQEFIPDLLELAKRDVKFFFHAGETNWNGASTDNNLYDAILLNTTRIGHGYAIVKHPQVLEAVKKQKIALEISPISNQVLKLVDDMRNHPAVFLIANDYPVVITCDDPSFWGAKGLSYDWYMAFMGFTHRNTDLKFLKQLALNSLMYTALDEDEKMVSISKWIKQWDSFIDTILDSADDKVVVKI